eukprot:jgi/Ulvmu1/4162/UM019_0141.1
MIIAAAGPPGVDLRDHGQGRRPDILVRCDELRDSMLQHSTALDMLTAHSCSVPLALTGLRDNLCHTHFREAMKCMTQRSMIGAFVLNDRACRLTPSTFCMCERTSCRL